MNLLILIFFLVGSLILFITVLKINPFLAFLLISIFAGILLGIPLKNLSQSIQKGIGEMMGSLLVVICLGSMLGKLVAESGAARVIADTMIKLFGLKYIRWGLLCTGFIIGIPLFFNVGFVICIPIIFALAQEYKLPRVALGLPMIAALSVAHGFLPPHPSPVALISIFHANMGQTLFLGTILAVPILILSGPVFSGFMDGICPIHPDHKYVFKEIKNENLPSIFNSFFSALIPVFLLGLFTLLSFIFSRNSNFRDIIKFLSEPAILMILALIIGSITLGKVQTQGMRKLMGVYEMAIQEISIILLILAGSGALKQVLIDSGTTNQIAEMFSQLTVPPLILAWLIAALIRVCLGSATVAGLTTASLILPIMTGSAINPSLMVLSIGSGSLMFSHVNDPGFWMFKEYFNLSLKDTFLSWSLMESLISVLGLIGVLGLNHLV